MIVFSIHGTVLFSVVKMLTLRVCYTTINVVSQSMILPLSPWMLMITVSTPGTKLDSIVKMSTFRVCDILQSMTSPHCLFLFGCLLL